MIRFVLKQKINVFRKNVDGFLICIKLIKFCLFLFYMVKNRFIVVKCIKFKERVLFFVKNKNKKLYF